MRVRVYVVISAPPSAATAVSAPRMSEPRSAKVQRIEKGISFFTEFGCTFTGTISALAPRTTRVLKIFDPTTLLTASEFAPLRAELIETDASGRLVPRATTVRPMMMVGTLRSFATLDDPSTNQSAPLIRSTKPPTSARMARKMFIFTCFPRRSLVFSNLYIILYFDGFVNLNTE